MECYKLPPRAAGLIFDMDGTLYTNDEYLQEQKNCLIRRLAQVRDKPIDEMEAEIEAYQKTWSLSHGGKEPSLGNTMLAFGVSIEESIRWREELIEPGAYVRKDPELREALLALGRAASLVLLTNNPVLTARKTLAILGVSDLFTTVVGLDICGVFKPNCEPFLKAVELLGVPPESCVSIGDRYDIDIATPLEMGMGGILVTGVEDVYRIAGLDSLAALAAI